MDYLLIGINHHMTPLEVREKFSLNEEELPQLLKSLLTLPHVEEGMILSTCNRVEILAATDHPLQASQNIKNFMVQKNHLEKALLEPHWYNYHSYDAVVHGFRVASSLDSMVVGEAQILGQVKKAFEQAALMETTGFYLNRYMHRAFYVAKQVRTHTGIAKGSVSIGSVAVDLVKKIFGTFNSKKVALIGVGKMGQLVINHLKALGVGEVSLLNRTEQNNCSPLSELPKVLDEVDVILTSLSSHDFLITEAHIKEAMGTRKNRPLFLIDLGVPRNIDNRVSHLNNVYLFNIDDLQNIAGQNLNERKKELVKAEELVKKEATKFYRFMLPQAVVNRILHNPELMLKSEEIEEGEWDANELLNRLFKLNV